jgi:hypothetical protein
MHVRASCILLLISVCCFAQPTNFERLIEGCKQCQSPCPSLQSALVKSEGVKWGVVKGVELSSLKLGVQFSSADSDEYVPRIADSSFLVVLDLNILSVVQGSRVIISVRDFAVRNNPPSKMINVGDSVLVGFEYGTVKTVIPIRNFLGVCRVEKRDQDRLEIVSIKKSP